MNSLDKDYADGLLDNCDPPCLSLYQPTHRRHPDNQQDPIRFRNLVRDLDESLQKQFSKDEIQPLLEPFIALAEDRDFWNHTFDGLAVLGSKSTFRVYKLQRPVVALAVSVFFLGETLTLSLGIGLCLILGGIAAVTLSRG